MYDYPNVTLQSQTLVHLSPITQFFCCLNILFDLLSELIENWLFLSLSILVLKLIIFIIVIVVIDAFLLSFTCFRVRLFFFRRRWVRSNCPLFLMNNYFLFKNVFII